jgi:hypothetical protein
MKAIADVLRKHAITIVLALAWVALFLSGLQHYAGSKTLFTLFSLVSLALLLSGLYRTGSFGYLFLSVFLWLGLWFKLTANFLLFGVFPFGEPVGNFNSSADAWDLVLYVAMAASLGLIFGGAICRAFRPQPYARTEWACAPSWYPAARKWLWAGIIVATIAGAVFNTIYGIHQVGNAPRTIFPWPTNALLAWFLNIGAALMIAVLVCWDVALRKNIGLPVYAMLGEAFITTVSVISRAAFPFHVIPQVFALYQRKDITQQYSRKQLLFFVATLSLLFFASIAAVSFLRDFQYAGSRATPTPEPVSIVAHASNNASTLPAEPAKQSGKAVSSFRWILIHQLLVNRWIGIEGVMAISSYDGKSDALLYDMLTEKREIGKVTAYQEVSKSGYQTPDAKFQFGSMPGMSGFLYYSGSLWVVFAGMMGIAVLVFLSERLIFWLTSNPIICSLYGMILANTVAQFGMTPRQDVPQYLMIYILIAGIWLIQTRGVANELH